MNRRRRMTLDSLERRDLLSITPLINSPGWIQAAATTTTTSTQTSSSSGLTFDPTTGVYTNQNLGGNGITTDVAPPRANEVARRAFTGKFTGNVQELAPRLVDQSRQYYILASGTTTGFLHGTAQVRYYTPNPNPVTFPDPTDPGSTITETATATTGTISMSDRSTQSGGVILANLTGSPTDEDSRGRPTRFDVTLNGGGGSGGIYASSVGSGTLTIAYKGNKATITIHASIFINGIGDPLDVEQNNRHL